MKTYDLIMSIGALCFCSENLRQYGLQAYSYPLDWVFGSTFSGRVKIVASKFENFLREEDLIFSHVEPKASCDAYKNTFNDLGFNHDFPINIPLNQSFNAVKEKYDRRINRLINIINQSKNVLFVYIEGPDQSMATETNETLINAQKELQKAFPNPQCDILYLEHNKDFASRKIIYEEVQKNILRAILNIAAEEEGAPSYAINTINLYLVLKNYKLTDPPAVVQKSTLASLFSYF